MTDSLGVTRYVYNELNRLKQVTDPFTGTVQYPYDAVGNRTQTIYLDGKAVTSTFDAANRLTSVNGQAYTWDNNGSLTNNGTFTYNHAGRLTRAQGITATQVYTYNGDPLRFAPRAGGLLMNRNATHYVWDQAADLPQMLSDGSTLYVPGVGQWNGTSWVYELTDGLGSVRQLSNAQGNIIQRYEYSPFGEVLAAEGQRPAIHWRAE